MRNVGLFILLVVLSCLISLLVFAQNDKQPSEAAMRLKALREGWESAEKQKQKIAQERRDLIEVLIDILKDAKEDNDNMASLAAGLGGGMIAVWAASYTENMLLSAGADNEQPTQLFS